MLIRDWLLALRYEPLTHHPAAHRPRHQRFCVSRRPAARFQVYLMRRSAAAPRIALRSRSRLP